jgi:hypothetical protein
MSEIGIISTLHLNFAAAYKAQNNQTSPFFVENPVVEGTTCISIPIDICCVSIVSSKQIRKK